MLSVLGNRTYARLLAAQVVALLGTGLLTVALGLLAHDLAGADAGAVLGTALAIKMLAYVGLAPVAGALAEKVDRTRLLVGADLVRAAVALALPFIDGVGQVYLAVFVLQAASATFTPAFQAAIPDVLPDERDYTRALSLSRLAYDIESLASPALAGLLLLLMDFHWLFALTGAGFLASAALVTRAAPPPRQAAADRPFAERLTRGLRIYLATPRLRGLLGLTLAAAAGSGFVFVNTVVVAVEVQGRGEGGLALVLAGFGAGSMAVALALPALLERVEDRAVMVPAAAAFSALMLAAGLFGLPGGLGGTLALWAAFGALYAAILTPAGRLLRRSAHAEDRPAVFAAQFALSHACWLVTYPLAGWGGRLLGLDAVLGVLGLLGALGVAAALRAWPADDRRPLAHAHPDLPPDHPHLRAHGGPRHAHEIVIDDAHRVWPTHG